MTDTLAHKDHWPVKLTTLCAKWKTTVVCHCGARIVRHHNEKEVSEQHAVKAYNAHCCVPRIES